MKIVIDIPEKLYNRIRSDNGHCYCSLRDDDMHEVVLALCDGVVIPQGHGDLIDRDEVRTKIKETCDYKGCNIGYDDWYLLKCTINNINTAISADKGE